MSYIFSNNGCSCKWVSPSENYQLQGGEVDMGPTMPTEQQLTAAFAGYAAAVAATAADKARLDAIDTTIGGFSFGGSSLAQLKAMDNTAFDSWWTANVTNLAQANTVLKLLARTVLRRVL